jgi:hypothetical protein
MRFEIQSWDASNASVDRIPFEKSWPFEASRRFDFSVVNGSR